jgi:tagatose 1,6-diphosphate aldolase GatY/KbaY
MAVVGARELLIKATEGRYSVGAFNITNISQMLAIVEAAVARRAPLIIQTSVSPSKSIGPEVIAAAYRAAAASAPIPIVLHLDHCTDAAWCKRCVDAGYTNIMYDGSHNSFEENVRITADVCAYAHRAPGVSVEGELGTVSGVEDQVRLAEDAAALCDPAKAVEFVERSGIDLFAPAIGTAHGIYKTENPKLDYERLEKIAALVNTGSVRAPLVIHGGTGLKPDVVRRLVALGGSKFNVSTELKHVLIDATWEYLSSHRDEYDPGKLDKHTGQATRKAIEAWIDLLGSAGKAA